MKISRKMLGFTAGMNDLELHTNAANYRVVLLNENIVRIRCTFEEQFAEEASYALAMTAWEDQMDGLLEERTRVAGLPVSCDDFGTHLLLSTSKLKIFIYKEPFAIEITDQDGQLLHADLKEKSYVQDSQGRLYHYSCMGDNDYFYGFGEKAGYLNKQKRRMRMHNVDTIGYDSEHTDPLYKHIPFYIKLNNQSKVASGLFYHNSYDSIFDMGNERSGYWNKYSYFCADGGELDVFFISGPSLKEVVRNYTDLTGKTILPPKYSLGYMGSTMYYTELEKGADRAILKFLDKCEQEGIPCDGFFLSSGYTTGQDGKRYVFNWNDDRFNNPEDFVAQMEQKGALLAPNIKPGMLTSHPLYDEFAESNAYILDELGEHPQIDRFWGGPASFVDFTNPKARELWKKHLKDAYISKGISSIWNDNNEYEMSQLESQCDFEGAGNKIGALRPVMPNLMALTAKQAIAEADPNIRPYIVSRAGFAGIQRYAQTWAGDNHTSWNSLKFNIPVILGMGLSGVANQGCDIGGFFGPAPEPELFVRWVQNGIFQPRFSIHSCNTDNTVTEPWMYPSYTRYIREAIQLRYQLMPYFYSLLYEASTEGSPVMRPLVYEFQQDANVVEESFDFMLGSSLLVANVLEKGAETRSVYLPEGTDWFDWHTKERYRGGQTVEKKVTLDSIPMFFRSGAIIPMSRGLRNIHKDPVEELQVLIEPSRSSTFVYYDDDGRTNRFLTGDYLKTTISIRNETGTVISFVKEGRYQTSLKTWIVDILCQTVAPVLIKIQDRVIPMYLDPVEWASSAEGWYYDMEQKTARIKHADRREDYHLTVNFDVKDLISI